MTTTTVFRLEFVEQPGQTKFGFDPPGKTYFGPLPPAETDNDGGTVPWASVCTDSTRDVVRLKIEPASAARNIELVVAQGATHLDVLPKMFSSAETDLQLIGKSSSGLALVEARLAGSSEVCAILSVRVLEQPDEPISIGVYRIIDSTSSATSPINAPSDTDIWNKSNTEAATF